MAPTRCGRCREEVDHDRDVWVACRGCLSRHHAACWGSEGPGPEGLRRRSSGPCAVCGEARALEGTPPVDVAGLPALRLVLGRERERSAEVDARLPLLAGRRDEPFAVIVDNETSEHQRVEVRHLPPWLRLEGPPVVDLPPGARACFPVVVLTALAPARARDLSTSSGPTDGSPSGTFVVSASDEAHTVGVWLRRAPTARQIVGLGLLGALGLPGVFVLVVCLQALLRRTGTAPTEAERAFLQRLARSDRRAALWTLAVLLVTVTTLVAALSLLWSVEP